MGNGAFAKVIWAKQLLSGPQNPEKIRYFARMVHSYNIIYPELDRPWNYYFNDAFMDLESNIDHVMELPQMVDHPEALFTPLFIKGILDESDTTFLRVLMENQIEGWPAQASIYFFRASEDKIWNSTQTHLAAQAIENKGGTVKTKGLYRRRPQKYDRTVCGASFKTGLLRVGLLEILLYIGLDSF